MSITEREWRLLRKWIQARANNLTATGPQPWACYDNVLEEMKRIRRAARQRQGKAKEKR